MCIRDRLKALGYESKITFSAKFAPSFKVLAKGKRFRGTKLDPFGYSELRRTERELVDEFEATITKLCSGGEFLDQSQRSRAIEIAELTDLIRGYEDLKMKRVAEYRQRMRELTAGI